MPQLNLATEVYRAQLVGRRRKLFYAASAVVVALVGLSWAVPVFLTHRAEQALAEVNQEIEQIQAQLRSRQDAVRPIVLFLERLALLRERLDAHQGWSRVLAELERLLPVNGTFKSLRGSADGGTLQAQLTVPSLDAAADLIASFQDVPNVNATSFRRVAVTSVSTAGSETGNEYGISLELGASPDLFRLSAPVSGGPAASPTPSPLAAP